MAAIAPFRAAYASDDAALAAPLLATADLAPDRERKVDALASLLIAAIREGPADSVASRRCCANIRSPPRRGWRSWCWRRRCCACRTRRRRTG